MENQRDKRLNVFINCPFDDDYNVYFYAIVFAIAGCGFVLRCALVIIDGGCTRVEKIVDVIEECRNPRSLPWPTGQNVDLSHRGLRLASGLLSL